MMTPHCVVVVLTSVAKSDCHTVGSLEKYRHQLHIGPVICNSVKVRVEVTPKVCPCIVYLVSMCSCAR